jgi:hypothetical protein
MSQRTIEQKQLITLMFAKKTSGKKAQDRSDMASVARRRRIEEIEENKRIALECGL